MKITQILFLCTLIIINVLPVNAEENKRIILLETMPVPAVLEHSKWLIHHLSEIGYRAGETVDLEVLQANGDAEQAETLLRKAINKKNPDLVVSNATLATKAAVKVLKDTDIPILFFTVSDPVGAGIISEIGVPSGTNVTGRVHMIDRKTRVDMVIRLVGSAIKHRPIRIGFIHSSYPSAIGDIRELKAIAEKNPHIEFISYELPYVKVPDGLPEMLEHTKKGIEVLKDTIDFWWEPSGPLGEVESYTNLLLNESKVQIVMGTKIKSVQLGGLLYLAPSQEGTGKEVAMIADSILKGTRPGDIPVRYPESMILGVNLSTAISMGITIPMDIMELAGENVYR
jgi:putative ABC transport system substrate-binding protein